MRLQAWQVGLDIQTGFARAIAVQRRRYGWQLRHWWQHPLPPSTLREGMLHQTEPLIALLSQWRATLPSDISLRICLPAQRIMQLILPEPDALLREPQRSAFLFANAAKQFPLSIQSLVMDYRTDPCGDKNVVVTAARQQELQHWLACLSQAKLFPQVVDIAPCALQIAASLAGLQAETPLLHQLTEGWLWASPTGLPFQFGIFDADMFDANIFDAEEHGSEKITVSATPGEAIRQQYRAAKLCAEGVYYSSETGTVVPAGMSGWSPFSALAQMSPPLPAIPSAFVLATGLALRPDDR